MTHEKLREMLVNAILNADRDAIVEQVDNMLAALRDAGLAIVPATFGESSHGR